MESNRKVALCILTYNNSDVISDVWDRNIYCYMSCDFYNIQTETSERHDRVCCQLWTDTA